MRASLRALPVLLLVGAVGHALAEGGPADPAPAPSGSDPGHGRASVGFEEGVVREGETLRARALGVPDERFGRVEARAASARTQAVSRAREALRRHLLARVPATELTPASLAALDEVLEDCVGRATVRLRFDAVAEAELALEVVVAERALGRELSP